jgi:hypothetical protein
VLPVWRTAFVVAEATPDRSRGTAAIAATFTGGSARPHPYPEQREIGAQPGRTPSNLLDYSSD